jgi:DNA primase
MATTHPHAPPSLARRELSPTRDRFEGGAMLPTPAPVPAHPGPRPRPSRRFGDDAAVLKRLYPIEDIVARAGVALHRSGPRLVGRCPFHDETSPSFTVYPAQGSYFCYGCGAGGDIFTFLMAHERCTFPEAMRRLIGGELRPTPRPLAAHAEPALAPRQQQILTVVAAACAAELAAARACDAALATAGRLDDARRERLRRMHGVRRADAALAYLRGRGVRDEALAPAHVGWCDGDQLRSLAIAHGWRADELIALGLLSERGHERLAGRITVPEFRQGRCVWLSGRTIAPPGVGPVKYLGVKAPRRALGLEAVAGQPRVLIVEGVIDFLIGLGWGLPTLALGGLGLRPDELAALRYAREIVLLLDADRAGQAEARRLAALIGPRARAVHPPPPAKDLADLALLPGGRARLDAVLRAVMGER